MSHVVITCTCGPDRIAGRTVHTACPVPGHGDVPPDPVDPWALVEAGKEATGHLHEAVTALMKARAACVSRGLDAADPFPVSLDRLAGSITYQTDHLREWTAAAAIVATKRAESAQAAAPDPVRKDGVRSADWAATDEPPSIRPTFGGEA